MSPCADFRSPWEQEALKGAVAQTDTYKDRLRVWPATPFQTLPAPAADPARALPAPPVIPRPKPGEELLDRRTVNSKTLATDKPGELRTELYEALVHFKDRHGRWTAIDDTLGTSKDGRRRNTANVFDLR